MVLFSYNRIYGDQTLSARITRGMFVARVKVENIVFADIFVFLHTKRRQFFLTIVCVSKFKY